MKSPYESPITSDNYKVSSTVIRKRQFIGLLLKLIFEVLPISSDAGAQPSTHRGDCLVDDMLLQTRPRNNQAPLRISKVKKGCTVD